MEYQDRYIKAIEDSDVLAALLAIAEFPTVDMDINYLSGMSPLMLAAEAGLLPIVEELCRRGADPYKRCEHDLNAMEYAAARGQVETVQFFIDLGYDLDTQDPNGASILHIVVRKGLPDTLLILLRSGANPNIVDHYGNTALHQASLYSNLESIQYLIMYGAGVDMQNMSGKTALHYAIKHSIPSVIELILTQSPNLHCKDVEGYTAISLLNNKGLLHLLKDAEDNIK